MRPNFDYNDRSNYFLYWIKCEIYFIQLFWCESESCKKDCLGKTEITPV